MSKISALLVIYNEQEKIRQCLESIKHAVDEIVVVHDGPCQDDSLNICKEYGCRIFVREHWGEAEPHRPFAIEQSSFPWVIFLDADERLSLGLRDVLKEKTKTDYDAFSFEWVAEINKKKSRFMHKQILFRKEKMYCIGLPHIQPETYGTIKKEPAVLLHDTSEFNNSFELLKRYYDKNKKWGKITAELLSGPLEGIPVYNCNLNDRSLKQVTKIMLARRLTFLAIIAAPLYNFLKSFIINKRFVQGFFGFVLSMHVPLHHFFACYYLISFRLKFHREK